MDSSFAGYELAGNRNRSRSTWIGYSRQESSEYQRTVAGYRSDVYTSVGWTYYAIVVWQFWGRAAEASW